jgi:hypothetical protein
VLHYTLNTDHCRVSPRSEVPDHALPLLAPLLEFGEHRLPGKLGQKYRLVVPAADAGFAATVCRGDAPLVTLGVAATEEDAAVVWPALEGLYLQITDTGPLAAAGLPAPHRPESLPWCAVVLLGPLGEAPGWLSDFERCLAWAWLCRRGE